MITLEARATSIEQNPTGLASTDHWERPDAAISTAKQDAHDHFFLDTPDGEWLPAGRIAHEVHRSAHAFIGETPLSRQVFLVAPGERTRPRNQKNIPLDAHFAYAHALETEYLQAVQNAEDQHLITHEEAVRQAGNMDSGAARVLQKRFRNQNQDVIRDGALIAAQATHMAIPAGIVGAGITLAARKKDGYGRRFRNVGKVMYMTSSGITVGSLVLSACTSVQALPTQEVRVTSMPEQFNPTVDQAKQAVASWMGMRIPLAEGEFGIFPTQAIFEVDPMDSVGQKLKTLSLLHPDGRTTDPDLRYAMGLALVPSEKTGEIVELPFLVQLGKNGEALMLGMFLDPAQSTEEVGVFRLNIVKDGQIRPVTQEMVVTKVAGGVTIALRDISDPKNIVTYHLVSTPKDVSLPPQQSAVPSQVPDNNWIDKVVAFMSGAGSVQAAEPATPEQLASINPLPSEAPEPSATPPPAESAPLIDVTLGNGEQFTIPADAVPDLVMPTIFYRLDGKAIPENEVSKWANSWWINENTDSHQFMKYHTTSVVNLTAPWTVSVDGEPTRYYTRIGTKDSKGNWHTYIVYLGTDSPDDEIGVRDHNGFSDIAVSKYINRLKPGQLIELDFIHDPPQDFLPKNNSYPGRRVLIAQRVDQFLDNLVAAIRGESPFPNEADGVIPGWGLTLP